MYDVTKPWDLQPYVVRIHMYGILKIRACIVSTAEWGTQDWGGGTYVVIVASM